MTTNHKLESVSIFNFRTFEGLTVVTFPQSGLFMIRGQNGSGKSNLVLAISYLLGTCRLPVKALQRWGAASMYVEAVVVLRTGERVLIHRGTDGVFYQKANLPKVAGAVKAVNEAIRKDLGAPPELLELLGYRDQIKPCSFLSMDDKRLKEVLSQIVGISNIELELETQADRLKEAKERLTLAQQKFELADAASAVANGNVFKYEPTDTSQAEAELMSAKRSVLQEKESLAELAGIEDELNAERQLVAAKKPSVPALPLPTWVEPSSTELDQNLTQCVDFLTAAEDAHKAELASYSATRELLLKKRGQIQQDIVKIGDLASRATALKVKIKQLDSSSCYTCGQAWNESQDEQKKLNIELSEVERLGGELLYLNGALAGVDEELANQVKPAQSEEVRQLTAIKMDLLTQKAALVATAKSQYASEVAAVKVKQAELEKAAMQTVADEIAAITDKVSANRKLLALAQERVDAANLEVVKLTATINSLKGIDVRDKTRAEETQKVAEQAVLGLVASQGERDEAVAAFGKESDYLDMIKGFRDKVFDEILFEISSEANAILSEVQNSQNVSVEFRSEQQTEQGKAKYRIKPVIYFDGTERTPDETLSGGQMMTLSLAVDLAVIKVGSARNGGGIGWLILDEYFHRLDQGSMQTCLDLLARYAINKLVIVIEHATEFKDSFPHTLTVTKEGGKSNVCQKAN